jgi:hypothetical protein
VVPLLGSPKSSSARCNKAKIPHENHDREGGYELFIACRICSLLICGVSDDLKAKGGKKPITGRKRQARLALSLAFAARERVSADHGLSYEYVSHYHDPTDESP